jgi:hypothetical protein
VTKPHTNVLQVVDAENGGGNSGSILPMPARPAPPATGESEHHTSLLAAMTHALHHHRGKPTPRGLRLYIASLDSAIFTCGHIAEELHALRSHAVELLGHIEAEDNAVSRFDGRSA